VITSNIHVGLVAWSNHTFVAGERCSNASNAYQCTTPGTSTSAPTGTGPDVDNGGAAHFKWLSAIDFTTLQAWADALANPLTDHVTGAIWNNGTITMTLDTVILYLGTRTASAFTVTVRPAPGEGIFDNPGPLLFDATRGVSFTQPSADGSTNYFNMEDKGLIFDGLQFSDPQETGTSTILATTGVGNILRNCIFSGFGRAGGKMVEVAGPSIIYNCLFIDNSTTASTDLLGTVTGPTKIINCLFISKNNVGSGQAVFCEGAGAPNDGHIVRNCGIFGGWVEPIWSDHTLQVTVDHSISDSAFLMDRAIDGGNNLVSKTLANQVISATADFRLKAGADCIHAAVNDLTDIPLGNDCYGAIRPSGLWDIGPSQYGIAGVLQVRGATRRMQPFLVQ
jgi:hypothetical protein